ncbi:MAG: CHAT domain-containing protein [Polyangiaceae bacterium]
MSTSTPPPPPDIPPDIAAFVRRVKRSSDPRAALLRPLPEERRDAVADRFLASIDVAQEPPVSRSMETRAVPSGAAANDAAPAPADLGPQATSRGAAKDPHAAESAATGQEVERPLAKVIPFRRARAITILTSVLAAAAMALLLPRFLISAPGAAWTVRGDQETRGDSDPGPEERVKVRPDTTLRLKITLDRPAEEVKARLVVKRGDAAVVAPTTRRILDGATLSLEQRADEMLGPQSDGPGELVLVAGANLPDEADAIEVALGKKTVRGFAVLRKAVLFEGWQKTGQLDRPGDSGVDLAGCAAYLADGTCEIGPERRLTLWAPGRPAVRIDGSAAGETKATEGRDRLEIKVPEGAKALTIAIGERTITFALRDAESSPRAASASAALAAGKLDDAESALAAPGAPTTGAAKIAEDRLRAKIQRRRALSGTGTLADAEAARLAVAKEARAAGRVSESADDVLAVVFSRLIDTRDVDGAKALLDASEADSGHLAETMVVWEYSHGLWARETGDLGAAVDDLERAHDRASRVGLAGLGIAVAPSLSEALAELGRSEEALSLLPSTADRTGCDLAAARSNRGWVRLLGGDIATAASELRTALVDAAGKCPADEPTLALNLSFAEQARGAPEEAARWLGASRSVTRPEDARLRAWQDRLEIQLALAADPRSAVAAADRLIQRAEKDRSPELRFEAELGRARALAALNQGDEAAAAFERADASLDDWARTTRVGQGREGLSARLDTAPRTWLSFFVDRAEKAGPKERAHEEARLSAATRRSLSRWVRTLSPLPKDASAASPPGPAAGELWLLFHPLESGALAVASTADGTRHVRIPAPGADPAVAAASLVAPFRADIDHAARVRLFVHRSFGALPLGAAMVADRTLAEAAPLAYGLGLDARDDAARPVTGRRALVVLDPRGDLEGARTSTAASALAARGFEVTELRGAEATRSAVLAALRPPCPDLLHFEGHGAHRGVDGQDAGLWLEGGELTVRDIRKLPCAPRQVVLAACDSARPSGVALTHAFAERGASAVLGASAALPDSLAVSVMKGLYAAPSAAAAAFDLPSALSSALRALRTTGGDVATAAGMLRIIVP